MAVKPFFSCVKSNQQWKTQGQYCWVYRLILVYVSLVTEESEKAKIVSTCQGHHGTPGNQMERACFHTVCYVENLQRTLSSIVEQFLNLFILWDLPFPVGLTVTVYSIFNGYWLLLILTGYCCVSVLSWWGCHNLLLSICCSKMVKYEELGIVYSYQPKWIKC